MPKAIELFVNLQDIPAWNNGFWYQHFASEFFNFRKDLIHLADTSIIHHPLVCSFPFSKAFNHPGFPFRVLGLKEILFHCFYRLFKLPSEQPDIENLHQLRIICRDIEMNNRW